jgi:hypothetical protein
VVTGDIPDYTLWFGNPARFIGHICRCTRRLSFGAASGASSTEAVCECGRKYGLVDDIVVPIP